MPATSSKAQKSTRNPTGKVRATRLMKAGGSIVAAIPAHALEALSLTVGSAVKFRVDRGRLIGIPVLPGTGNRIGFAARMAACDLSAPISANQQADDDAWFSDPPRGREVI